MDEGTPLRGRTYDTVIVDDTRSNRITSIPPSMSARRSSNDAAQAWKVLTGGDLGKNKPEQMFNPNNTRPAMISEGDVLTDEYIPNKELTEEDNHVTYIRIIEEKRMTFKQEWFVLNRQIRRNSTNYAKGTVIRMTSAAENNTYAVFYVNREKCGSFYFSEITPINLKDSDKKKAIKVIDRNGELIQKLMGGGSLLVETQDNFIPESGVGADDRHVTCPHCEENLVIEGYRVTVRRDVRMTYYGAGESREMDRSEIRHSSTVQAGEITCNNCDGEIDRDEYDEVFDELDIS